MKNKFIGAQNSVPKLFCTVVLSGFLVACGGGGGDGTDEGTTADLSTATDGESTLGDLGLDDGGTNGTDDGSDLVDADINNNGIPDKDEPCKGKDGTDSNSSNEAWNDNCYIQQLDAANPDRSPFFFSYYTMGIQRVLFCQGHGGDAETIEAFADGDFRNNTHNAVREFQVAQGLTEDGIVGMETWGRLQELVELDAAGNSARIDEASNDEYHAFGVRADAATVVTQNFSLSLIHI